MLMYPAAAKSERKGETCTREHGQRVKACPSGKGSYPAFNECYKRSVATFTACIGDAKAASAHATSWSKRQIQEFLESVACSQLPMGTCELLNAENSKHNAHAPSTFSRATLRHAELQAAKQLVETGDASRPAECRSLLELLNIR